MGDTKAELVRAWLLVVQIPYNIHICTVHRHICIVKVQSSLNSFNWN